MPVPQEGFVVGGLAPGGFRGGRPALSGSDVEPRLQGKAGEECQRGRKVFVAEVIVVTGEELFVKLRADYRDDVALFGGGDVGLAEGLGREVFALPEGEFQELER